MSMRMNHRLIDPVILEDFYSSNPSERLVSRIFIGKGCNLRLPTRLQGYNTQLKSVPVIRSDDPSPREKTIIQTLIQSVL